MSGTTIRVFVLGSAMLLALCFARESAAALGEEPRAGKETLTQYLTPAVLAAIFPGAERIGEVDGTPPAAAVYKGKQQVGYVFSTWDVTQSKGFSNRPLVLLVGIDFTAHIAGARLVHHSEPIAILGLSDEALQRFTENYKGHDINKGVDVVKLLLASRRRPQTLIRRSCTMYLKCHAQRPGESRRKIENSSRFGVPCSQRQSP